MTNETPSSLTAYIVCTCVARLGATGRWSGVLAPEAVSLAETFAREIQDAPSKRLLARLPTRALVGLLDLGFVPGMAQHFLLRKQLIEAETRRAVAAGARQLLVLGAGLDTLSLRLTREFPALTAVEIDLPQTQRQKFRVLQELGHPLPPNLHLVPANLGEELLPTVLRDRTPLRGAPEPTVVVIEGVLMYLQEPAVQALFRTLRDTFGSGLVVIFGAIARPDTAGSLGLRTINWLLSKGQEGTSWACPAAQMPAFLAPLGLVVARTVTYRTLQAQTRSPDEIRRVPEEDENYFVAVVPH